MSEPIVADFVGQFHTSDLAGAEPVRGRVLLSQRRLVLANGGGKTTIPLSSVFDVTVGFVPMELTDFFNDTVTLAYEAEGARRVAVVEAAESNVERFVRVLFKVLLNGAHALVRHPVRVGGRVVEATTHPARLSLRSGGVRFVDCPEPFEINLREVIHIERLARSLGEGTSETLAIRQMRDDSSVTSLVALTSRRKVNILGRYIRLEYGEVMAELESVSCTDEEMEALVSLYSTGGQANLAKTLGVDPTQVTLVLNALREKELVADSGGTTRLTPKGRVLVMSRLEDVNS
jgi:helix-turn-helix protein